jgi:hypothetical protein
MPCPSQRSRYSEEYKNICLRRNEPCPLDSSLVTVLAELIVLYCDRIAWGRRKGSVLYLDSENAVNLYICIVKEHVTKSRLLPVGEPTVYYLTKAHKRCCDIYDYHTV